jgi:hypothetical protein
MKRAAILFVLTVFATEIVVAQQQPANPISATSSQTDPNLTQVQLMLQSDAAKDQAWGAWWTSQLRLTSLLPQIEKNLESHLPGRDEGDQAVIDTSLDALIQLQSATVPLDVIESVYRRGRTPQAMILLAQSRPGPPLDEFLLKLMDEEAGQGVGREWYAAADLMLMQKRPGLVASLLRGLHIQAYIVVCDAGKPCRHQGVGSGGIGDGPGFGGRNSIYPPWPYYSLSTVNAGLMSRTPVLFQGPVSLTYNRGVASTFPSLVYDRFREQRYPPNPTTMDRLRYISAAAPTVQVSIHGDEDSPVSWKDIETYRAESQRIQDDLRNRYTKLIEQLRDAGLLSLSEFDSVTAPPLNFITVDQRSAQTPPLQ